MCDRKKRESAATACRAPTVGPSVPHRSTSGVIRLQPFVAAIEVVDGCLGGFKYPHLDCSIAITYAEV